MRFMPTIIGFPCNAGIAAYTTNVTREHLTRLHINGSRGNFNGFRSGAISPLALRVSGGFCQSTFLCHCLFWLTCCAYYLQKRGDVKAWKLIWGSCIHDICHYQSGLM